MMPDSSWRKFFTLLSLTGFVVITIALYSAPLTPTDGMLVLIWLAIMAAAWRPSPP
jgi:hypothetical protein